MSHSVRCGMFASLSCALTIIIASACAARSQSTSPTAPSKNPNPSAAYSGSHNRECKTNVPSAKLGEGTFTTFKYDIDVELDRDMGNGQHGAICLSSGGRSGPDSITWFRGSKKKFTIKYSPVPKDPTQSCPDNPFDQALPDPTFGYVRVDTGAPRSDIKDCLYNVEIKRPDATAADPHIIIN